MSIPTILKVHVSTEMQASCIITARNACGVLFVQHPPHSGTYSTQHSPSWEANRFSAIQKIPLFYGSRSFITAFTSARHLSLSWASSIQSIPQHPTSWRSFLIFSSYIRLGLPSGLLPSGFHTKPLYTPLLSSIRATCSAHLLDFITQTVLCEQYRSLGSS